MITLFDRCLVIAVKFTNLGHHLKSQRFLFQIDPTFHRVPLSAWLNFRRNDLAVTHLGSCSKKFKDCFAKVACHGSGISMGDLESYIDPKLMPYVLKNITEYFGEFVASDILLNVRP